MGDHRSGTLDWPICQAFRVDDRLRRSLSRICEAATIPYGLMKFEPPGGQAGTFHSLQRLSGVRSQAAAFAAALPLSHARCLMLAA